MLGGSARDGRDSLLAGAGAGGPVSASGERGLAKLRDTQKLVNDTETLGQGILGSLADQRGQLEGSIETRAEAHAALSTSNRLIRTMSRRATWMKLSLVFTIVMLLTGIFLVVCTPPPHARRERWRERAQAQSRGPARLPRPAPHARAAPTRTQYSPRSSALLRQI